ncbi:MAG: NYN domain-containing protein [Selenomonas ruminantium]|uniref:NYN domain-containing protein n=1 Tax=Selenomonas ruminantium TaxID=971 RepID=A0A927WRS6_SELRU|nr:NYN domain-containing protein [Selenomonas ruminantium]
MTLDSSNEVVAILYDIENAPFEMLNYTLGKARRYQPCRTIVVSDWEARPEQKRWEKLMRRPGFTFRQISRTYHGKNSLDSAIYDSAKLLYDEGVRRFFIITTDSDFVRIAEYLNSDTPSYIIGVGTKQASETLRNAYDEFMVYPPEEKEKKTARKTKAVKDEAKQEKKTAKAAKETTATKTAKTVKETKAAKAAKTEKAVKTAKNAKVTKAEDNAALSEGNLTVKLPRTLRESLQERQAAEGVSMDELVTYLLMRGMARWVED